MGFPDSSVGKESACNAGGPGSIPGLGRSAGEEIGYPLQYYWASLVAQLVKNPPAMWETWVSSLGWEDPLEKGKATHSSILAWRIYLDSLCNKQMSGFSGPRCCGWQGLYSSAGGEQWSTSNTVCWHWWLLGRKVRKKNKEQGGGGGGGRGCKQTDGEGFPEEIFPDSLRKKRALEPLVFPSMTGNSWNILAWEA